MRIFYCKCINKLTILYLFCVCALTFRLIYNEYYSVLYRGVEVSYEDGEMVYPLGEIVGIYTECEGVFVIDTSEIELLDGSFKSPAEDMLQKGDYILQVNGQKVYEKESLVKIVNESKGNSLEMLIARGESTFLASITPEKGKNGKYMLGVWVKDDLAGVGTITYYTEKGTFAALGHGMGDGVTNEIFSVKEGDIYFADLIGIKKGKRGAPGEVRGIISYGTLNHIGELDTNCNEGIYGILDEEDLSRYKSECEPYKLGDKKDIEVGAAQIISNISGVREVYDIRISYVDYLAVTSNKGLHIEVVDSELLELTGGIVQGMSGSPIIQNGKLIGAVTHVLINDPAKGYGIFINNMLEKEE